MARPSPSELRGCGGASLQGCSVLSQASGSFRPSAVPGGLWPLLQGLGPGREPQVLAAFLCSHLQIVISLQTLLVVPGRKSGHWKLISSAVEVEAGGSFDEQDAPL